MTSKKEAFLASSIQSHKFPRHTEVWLVRRAMPGRELSFDEARFLAGSISVKEVLVQFPDFTSDREGEREREKIGRSMHYRRIRDLCSKKGLTRIDWGHLPRRTVTLARLKQLPRQELLDLPVAALGTMTPHSLGWLDLSGLTVQGLLDTELRSDYHKSFRKGIGKTQALLRALRFTEDDGAFMRINSLKGRAHELAVRHNLSKPLALRIVKIAQAEHWLPKRLV